MDFFDRLRLLYAMLTRGSSYATDFLRVTNRRFCNNTGKIIGWHRGLPSYFLLWPPVMSRPAANSITTRIMSVFQWRRLPDMVTLAVTDRCNCACPHCSFTSMKKSAAVLSLDEIRRIIGEIQGAGASTVALTGGEPLLREDLPAIIRAVDRDFSQVVVFTNGWHLAERAAEISRAGATSVIVGLDHYDEAAHDRSKSLPGAFRRAVAGLAEARRRGLLTGISYVAYREGLRDGTIEKVFDLARRLRVNQVIVFDAMATGSLSRKDTVAWSAEELDELIGLCERYTDLPGRTGFHPYAYTRGPRGIGCAGGVSICYVGPYGDLYPCDFTPLSVGSLREHRFSELWDRFSLCDDFACSALDGCRMNNPAFRKKYARALVSGRFPAGKR